MAIGCYVLYEIVEIIRSFLGYEHREIRHWIVFIAYFFAMKAFVIGDIRLLRGKRLSAYHWFNEGLLVWLLVVQVFLFLQSPLKALFVLIILLLLLGAIRYMIAEEKSLHSKQGH
jgi:phosphatidylserine synthase